MPERPQIVEVSPEEFITLIRDLILMTADSEETPAPLTVEERLERLEQFVGLTTTEPEYEDKADQEDEDHYLSMLQAILGARNEKS